MKKIKAIKIDVESKSIYEVEIESDNIVDIHKHLRCEYCESIKIADFRSVTDSIELLYVDEEGLINENKIGAFQMGDELKISGNGLIMGCNSKGQSISTKLSLESVINNTIFISIEDLPEPKIEVMNLEDYLNNNKNKENED